MAEEYTLLEKYENDNQGFESFADYLIAEVEVWKARHEESNHHLDLMVECYGVEALVELVEDEK